MKALIANRTLRIVVLAGAGLAITVAILLSGSFSAAQTTAPPPDAADPATAQEDSATAIPVEVTEAATGAIAAYLSATANLVPEDQVDVLAEIEGRVADLKVEEGDRVGAGEVLATLDRGEVEIALHKARLRAGNAEAAYQRARDTLDDGLISREEFDRIEMEHEVARQEVAEAEWRLGRTVIRAPFAGVVTERAITPGQHLRQGEKLFTVADFQPLVARIFLPESDVLDLTEGREVRISLAADTSIAFAGRIRRISPVVDTATGTVKVTVEATRAPAEVRPGAFVTVGIVREARSGATLLPLTSVIRELRSAHVFVTDGETAHKRAVTLGLEEDDMVEILSGVEPGETVVVAGQGGLRDGSRIKIL